MAPLVEVEDLTVAYATGATALSGVALRVEPGQRVAVIGPNGAGKTTLTRVLIGALGVFGGRVRSGHATFDGLDVTRATPAALIRAGVAHVPEGRGMFATLTVEDNVRLAMAALPRRQRPSLDEMLGIFPVVAERRRTQAGLLSGGQQQMVAIVRALATRPRLLIADELSLGLAPLTTKELVGGLERRSIDDGLTVLLVEQSATTALKFSEHCYILENGELVADAPSSEFLARGTAHSVYLGEDPVVAAGEAHG